MVATILPMITYCYLVADDPVARWTSVAGFPASLPRPSFSLGSFPVHASAACIRPSTVFPPLSSGLQAKHAARLTILNTQDVRQ